jgi:hypothetical protein
MESVKFADIKNQLCDVLEERIKDLGAKEKFTLIEGFFNQPIQNEISGNIMIGGPTVPMVAIVGNQSGRMYLFALKILLPKLEI